MKSKKVPFPEKPDIFPNGVSTPTLEKIDIYLHQIDAWLQAKAKEIPKMRAFLVKQDSLAFQALMKICESSLQPGSIIPLEDGEFESLGKDCIQIEISDENID